MTPKQILDSFSETLMQDERILSSQERSLLVALLQHAKAAGNQTSEMQQAVRAVIASAVGETVAQRAFSVLGTSIVERILESTPVSLTDSAGLRTPEMNAVEPQPPRGPQAPGPGVKEPHKAPHAPMRSPGPPNNPPSPIEPEPPRAPMPPQPPSPIEPQPPRAPQPPRSPMRDTPVVEPQPPRGTVDTNIVARADVAVAERPTDLPARCVVLDEFLTPQELRELTDFALEHEADFQTSEVVSPEVEGGVVNYEHRRSRVLMDLGRQQELILDRIKNVLPQVLEQLGMEEFSIAGTEIQITSSNDGDFFHFHSDNGSERVCSRYLTFVYFFHREPPKFEGGELRIHDARLKGDAYVSQGSYQTIVPRQNQVIFFPCELMHEITPVKCPSGLFADSRFTVNGWLRR
jgi:Rps23 Pro-64 3,4-dihydroxylase Tpa1-like proline 4-hydroxylase